MNNWKYNRIQSKWYPNNKTIFQKLTNTDTFKKQLKTGLFKLGSPMNDEYGFVDAPLVTSGRGVIWGGWGTAVPPRKKKKKKKKKEKRERKEKKREQKKEGNYD